MSCQGIGYGGVRSRWGEFSEVDLSPLQQLGIAAYLELCLPRLVGGRTARPAAGK